MQGVGLGDTSITSFQSDESHVSGSDHHFSQNNSSLPLINIVLAEKQASSVNTSQSSSPDDNRNRYREGGGDKDVEATAAQTQVLFDFDTEYRISLADHVPFHVNRWVMLCLFAIYLIFNGQCVQNWPPFRSILINGQAYAWKCTDSDVLDPAEGTCQAQRDALASLGSTSMSLVFIGSFIGGIALDYLGPRLLATFASLLATAGYCFLAFAGQSFQTYYVGFACVALSIEMAMTGLFDFPFLFPGQLSLILSILGVGRSVAFAYPVVLEKLAPAVGYQTTFLIATGVGGVCSIIAFFLVPRYPYLSPEQFRALLELEDIQLLLQQRTQTFVMTDYSESSVSASETTVSRSEERERPLSPEAHSACSSIEPGGPPAAGEFFWGGESVKRQITEKSVISMDRRTEVPDIWGMFFSTLLSVKFLPWLVSFSCHVLRCTFFGNSAADQLGEASDFYVIMGPLSFIPCVPFGMLADHKNCFWSIVTINFCGFMATLLLCFSQSSPFNYISVAFYWFLQSYSTSQNYVYNAQLFAPVLMGKITGTSMLCAGLLSFAASPLYELGSSKGFTKADIIATVLGGVSLVLPICLIYIHRTKLREMKASNEERKRVAESKPFRSYLVSWFRASEQRLSSGQRITVSPELARLASKGSLLSFSHGYEDAYKEVVKDHDQGGTTLAEVWSPSRDTSKIIEVISEGHSSFIAHS